MPARRAQHQRLSVWWRQSRSRRGAGTSQRLWRRQTWQQLHPRPSRMLCAPAPALTAACDQDHPSHLSMMVRSLMPYALCMPCAVSACKL